METLRNAVPREVLEEPRAQKGRGPRSAPRNRQLMFNNYKIGKNFCTS